VEKNRGPLKEALTRRRDSAPISSIDARAQQSKKISRIAAISASWNRENRFCCSSFVNRISIDQCARDATTRC